MDASGTLRIRPATHADRSAIDALVIQNHLALSEMHPDEYVGQAMDLANDFEHLINPLKFAKSFFFVAEQDDGTIVACAGIIPTNVKENANAVPTYNEMELTGVTVEPNHRRKGLAKSLVLLALQKSRSRGCQLVELVTLKERMSAACALYESLGFELLHDEVVHYEEPIMTVRRYTLNLEQAKIEF
jgi:ribosomal protein S18 acetylase RimI-like enzyme